MTYAYPWCILFALALLLASYIAKREKQAVRFGSVAVLPNTGLGMKGVLRILFVGLSALLVVYALTAALLRPQEVTTLPSTIDARNIILALDVSGSMRTRDFYTKYAPTSRLEAVKSVVAEFIAGRPHDRIGLVVFGSAAYLECPLTSDHSLLSNMITELEVGMAGDGTALGDGLGIALKRIESIPGDSKAIILLTDGVSTAGSVNPEQAAKVAADMNIKVHTIGIGSSKTAQASAFSSIFSGMKTYEFDAKTLRSIATITGGVYFNAKNLEELKRVYSEIDALETSEKESPQQRQVTEHFQTYALIALASYCFYLLATLVFLPRFPW